MTGSGGGCPTRPRHGASGPSLTWPRGAREASAERLLGVASRPGSISPPNGSSCVGKARVRRYPRRIPYMEGPEARPVVRRRPPGGSAHPERGRGRRDGSRRCSGRPPSSTLNELVAREAATTSGSRTSDSSDASDGSIHGGPESRVEARGEAPQVHGDAGVPRERDRLPPVAGDEVPFPVWCGRHLAPLVHPEQACRRRPTRQTPRVTGEEPMTASARR